MYVNGFWFGVLMAIVIGLVAFIVIALIASHRVANMDDEMPEIEPIEEDKFKEYLREVLEDIAKENRFIIGEAVEDKNCGEEEEN